MKFLFIVQGEGRGHMTQAMTLECLLLQRGHEVLKIMVGRSPQRTLPDFFVDGVNAPVQQFDSVNFMPSSSNKRPDMIKTVVYNSIEMHKYFPSISLIADEIRNSGADVVVNFYELLAGMAYFFHSIDVPMVCIGHQYLFMHKDFGLPREKYPGSLTLDVFSRLTAYGAVKHLALSFREMPMDVRHNIVVVPPLLRQEVLELVPTQGDYIHGYMLNSGFSEDVLAWHQKHPEVKLRFFWDNQEQGKVYDYDDNLRFYLIDDNEFLKQMSGCYAYASTAGFESICEAMYLGKPILMVPSHLEQEINAFDAVRSGVGVTSDSFDLSVLLEFSKDYIANPDFKTWVDSAAEKIANELENIQKS